MERMRKTFEGVANIVRFNWHYYVLAVGGIWMLIALGEFLGGTARVVIVIICLPAFVSILFSLAVSFYVYDLSNLYSLDWLGKTKFKKGAAIVNINAGFDETSELLNSKFPDADLMVLDFYDPDKHTEISIKRARKAYPPFRGTLQTRTGKIPLENNFADAVFLILSAHEIRDSDERSALFKELSRIVKPDGRIVVTEHLRDLPNLLAYTAGAFHFHSRKTWVNAFDSAGLKIAREIKITPFVTSFILEKNGTSS